MDKFYTVERNMQMLISLMKSHGVKKVVISPGTTNVTFVGSVQNDPYFELYSCLDEHSAAYMACGLAEESGEPVALSCTGATASRNYVSGLTEAYYRKLPILAITASQHLGHTGQMFPQMLDRSILQNDIANLSVTIPTIHDSEDEWASNVKINEALLALRHRGGGPVHLNMVTKYSGDFSVRELPKERVIRRYNASIPFPKMIDGRVAVLIGSHSVLSSELTENIDEFCANCNAVVLCDQTSNYRGKYRILANILCDQKQYKFPVKEPDLLIHIGEISGAYMSLSPKEVWRVSLDGAVKDPFKKLTNVFEIEEDVFFKYYASEGLRKNSYLGEWKQELYELRSLIPDLPFSNIWVAQQTAHLLPENSVLHLGILNSLRSWNYFETPENVSCYSNTGGFGIDGCVSSLLGASLANKEKLYFGVIGDLAFFYDLNAIGNRHVGKNLRIILINNGRGTEFRNYNHPAERFGDDADKFMAAAHHNGYKSQTLIKHFAEDLCFEYLSASNKDEYMHNLERFVTKELTEKPILFEVFTDSKDESDALKLINHLKVDTKLVAKQNAKEFVRSVIGDKAVEQIKKLIKR